MRDRSAIIRALEGLEDRNRSRFHARREIRVKFADSLKNPSPARMLPKRENEAASQKALGSQSSLTEELIWKNPSRRY